MNQNHPDKHPSSRKAAFTFIDLFAGIGGMRKGFEAVGGQCVFSSEWNKFSRLTYAANFDCNHLIAGDIALVEASAIPPHDLLLADFPCQPFSIAGISKKNSLGRPHGFECATQGNLFFEIVRILASHKPAAFLFFRLFEPKGGNSFDPAGIYGYGVGQG